MPKPGPEITALVRSSGEIRLRGVDITRTLWLPRSHVVIRDDGIRLTSPARTAFDLAALVSDERFESIVEQLLDEEWCSLPSLLAMRRGWVARGRPGSALVNRVLDSRAPDAAPVGSNLELRVLNALADRGIHLERQYKIDLPNGRRIRVDGADLARRWILEVDHFTWHGGRVASGRDKSRTQ